MVKHGRNKKRRAGRIGKTKIKNPYDRKLKILDPTIRKHWDHKKSPKYNLSKLGLLAKPNTVTGTIFSNVDTTAITTAEASSNDTTDTVHDDSNSNNVIELFDIPSIDVKVQKHAPLKHDEQKYIANCLRKYYNNNNNNDDDYINNGVRED